MSGIIYVIRRQLPPAPGRLRGSIAFAMNHRWWEDTFNGWTDVPGRALSFSAKRDAATVARALRILWKAEMSLGSSGEDYQIVIVRRRDV